MTINDRLLVDRPSASSFASAIPASAFVGEGISFLDDQMAKRLIEMLNGSEVYKGSARLKLEGKKTLAGSLIITSRRRARPSVPTVRLCESRGQRIIRIDGSNQKHPFREYAIIIRADKNKPSTAVGRKPAKGKGKRHG